MRRAAMFPGQGSQRVGMGRDLADIDAELVQPVFDAADAALGFSLSTLCFEGPEEELRRTENTQPAIFLVSHLIDRLLQQRMPPPAIAAGHSLGEYSALVAAGVLDWTEALLLVRRRGELMAAVNERTPGAMLAVIGVRSETVEAECATARDRSGEVVEVANYNDDRQTVVSATVTGAAAYRAVAAEDPDPERRIVPLEVGAPFHCSLMRPVEDEFSVDLDRADFADPALPVVANATARIVTTGAEARRQLKAQLSGPVRWRQSLTTMVDDGVDTFVETGPGRVLSGLSRRAYPELSTHSASDARRIRRVLGDLTTAPPAVGAGS